MAGPDFLTEVFRALVRFHDFTIWRHGGLPGFRDEGLLRLAVARPWMTVLGEPILGSRFQQASAIAEAIVCSHPFNDGNHRTALAAAEMILGLQNVMLVAPADEKRDSIRNLGIGTMNLEQFSRWLEKNSVLRARLAD